MKKTADGGINKLANGKKRYEYTFVIKDFVLFAKFIIVVK